MIAPASNRQQLRQALRARRRGLDAAARATAAHKLAGLLADLVCYHSAGHIAAYVAVESEIDPEPLLQQAYRENKRIYLPILPQERTGTLQFVRWQPSMRMQPNRVGIPEPSDADQETIAPEKLDLVLTPLVAFDHHGQRLGTGGGYYDRTFAFLKGGNGRPRLLGLAYEFQRLERIEPEPWDVRLNGVVTDQHVYFCSANTLAAP